MVVTIKENDNTELLLEDPKDVIEKPSTSPESPKTREDATALAARKLRTKLALDKCIQENDEK